MENEEIQASEPVNEQPEPDKKKEKPPVEAGMLNRVIARAIDFIIVAALLEIIPRLGFIAGLVYLLVADGLFGGSSVGKKLIGMKVIVKNDTAPEMPCGYKESIYRNGPFGLALVLGAMLTVIPLLGWLLSFVLVTGVVVFESLVLFGSENSRRLGDELAKTLVVEDR